MKQLSSKSHPALLNVRTEGNKLRLALPVTVQCVGRTSWTKLPGGAKVQLEASDLLKANGAPFRYEDLRSEVSQAEQKAYSARQKRNRRR